MRYVRVIAVLLVALLVVSACSGTKKETPVTADSERTEEQNREPEGTGRAKEDQPKESPSNADDEDHSSSQDELAPDEQGTDDPQADDAAVHMERLQKELIVGTTKEELFEYLGDVYTEVTSVIDGTMIWRFDLATKPGYTFLSEVDAPDMRGLQNGDIRLQIFVTPDENGNLLEYMAYEAREDGTILVYYMFEDGSKKTDTIVNETGEDTDENSRF